MIASFVFTKNIIDKEKISYFIPLFILVVVYKVLSGANIFGAAFPAIIISIIYLIKNDWLIYGFKVFKSFLSIILIPSVFLWIIHHSIDNSIFYLGAISSDIIPNKLKVVIGQGYALYPFTVVLDNMLLNDFYRMSGPFDEPGVVGTISALILAADRYSFKDKRNIILFIAGVLSLSLAFYLMTFVYFAFVSIKRPKFLIFITIFLISIIGAASFNEKVKRYTIERVQVSDGKLSGDNRLTIGLELGFRKWADSSGSVLFFGIRDYIGSGEASYKQIPVKAGLVGVLVFLAIFLFTILSSVNIKDIDNYMLVFVFVFFISIYQRPDVVNAAFYFIFASGISKSRAMRMS